MPFHSLETLSTIPTLRHLIATLASYASWPLHSQPPSQDSSAFPPPRCHIEQHQHAQRPSLHLDLHPATATPDDESDSSSSSPPSVPSSPTFKFAQFDVDHRTGFAPNTTAEITRLPSAYDFWEDHLASANSSLSLGQDTSPAALARRPSGVRWRSDFLSAPVLDTAPLQQDPRLLRRAHHVLAFLVHFYVHSTPPHHQHPASSILIPKALAIPLYAVSNALGIAPVLTFADTVLWNFAIIDPSQPLTRTNIRPLTLFTGGADEWSFYGCCAEIELRGVEALRAIADCQDVLLHARQRQFNQQQHSSIVSVEHELLTPADLAKVASCLQSVALVIDDLTIILQSVRSICDPYAFYTAVRPWFRGSDASGPESPQWIFQGVHESDQLELSGPSAGQSSIIHTLDAFLQVDHNATTSPTAPTTAATSKPPASCPHASRLLQQQKTMEQREEQHQPQQQEQIPNSLNGDFMTRMRKYMPGSHQAFLALIDRSSSPSPAYSVPSSVRSLAAQYPGELHEPYNAAVKALKKFRDIHIQIACLYIVTQSRRATGPGAQAGAGGGPGMTMMPSACPMMAKKEREPIRGTGGNELASLLKACRDATTRALLPHPPTSS